MVRTIAIANQKGGVGKSTTAAVIAEYYKTLGVFTVIADLDAQGNLGCVFPDVAVKFSASDVLLNHVKRYTLTDSSAGAVLIYGDSSLSGFDNILTKTGKEFRLTEFIKKLCGENNIKDAVCVVDTPPALGILTVNALTAADEVLIPATADAFSIQGTAALLETIEVVRRYCNPLLKATGILLTRFSPRSVISRETAQALERFAADHGTKLFKSRIREGVAVREAQSLCRGLLKYAPKSPPALDYKEFLTEIV